MLEVLAWDPAAGLSLRTALALLLLFAAAHKLRNPGAFREAVGAYEIVPASWTVVTAALVIGAELAIGTALMRPSLGPIPPLAAAGLLAIYTGGIAVNVRRGRRDLDCGCSGPAGRMPVSGALIARNGALIGTALAAALPMTARPLLWLDAFTIAACVAALGLLYAAADTALGNAARLRWLRGGPHAGDLVAASTIGASP